jgi:hypothetical protein
MMKPRFAGPLTISLVVLFLVAAAVLVLVYLRATSEGRSQIEIEAVKSMLQIMAVAIIGGVVTMLIREHEERRKAWVARRDLLRTDLSAQLRETYAQSKRLRRLLRVATDPTNRSLEYSKYAELLGDLSDIQLERLKQAADAGARLAIIPQAVPANLQSMERYLGELVTEYDSPSQQKEQSVMLADRPKLSDFTAKAYESTFKQRFSKPFNDASLEIEKVIEADLRRSRAG